MFLGTGSETVANVTKEQELEELLNATKEQELEELVMSPKNIIWKGCYIILLSMLRNRIGKIC